MSQVYVCEPHSPIETIAVRAFPRHQDGTQVMVADVATVDVFAFQHGSSDPIWSLRDQTTTNFLSDTASLVGWTADVVGWTFHHDLGYGASSTPAFYPAGGSTVALHYILHLTGGVDVLEIEVHVPLRDSRAARHLSL